MGRKILAGMGIILAAVLFQMSFVEAEVNMNDDNDTYVSLKIYAYTWNAPQRGTLFVDDIRRFSMYRVEILDGHRISRIADIVAGGERKYIPWAPHHKRGIVFDFYGSDGTINTFFAEDGYICDPETKKCWETDFTKLSKIGEIINEDVWKPMKTKGGKR